MILLLEPTCVEDREIAKVASILPALAPVVIVNVNIRLVSAEIILDPGPVSVCTVFDASAVQPVIELTPADNVIVAVYVLELLKRVFGVKILEYVSILF
jgi:hypothetical protein